MKIVKLPNEFDFKRLFSQIGSSKAGVDIMYKKSNINFFYLHDIKTPAANILKQDALSIGAELVVPKDTICCTEKEVDAILIVTDKQLETLIKKEKIQPFGLKELSAKLAKFQNLKKSQLKVMGIINANDDSFYELSRFRGKNAIKAIEKMIEDKADIIDIGGVSSRPGSVGVSEDEEFKRVKPVIDEIYKHKLHDKIIFSIDSYSPKNIKYALDHGFSIVNDITGLSSDEVCKLISSYDATAIIMHMQKRPKDMQEDPTYENVVLEIDDFFQHRIAKAKEFGIKDIILDVGIGFGKTLKHNLILIKHQKHFLKFGYELLVGASRKSMIDNIVPSLPSDRLAGTLTLHLEAIKQGASIIRVHDVKEHIQAFKVQQYLNEVLI